MVTHGPATATGASAPDGFASQPIFIFKPVEGSLNRFVRGQAAPLIAANVAQREAIFERTPLQLSSQSLRGAQTIVLEEPVAAPCMGLEIFAPSRRTQRRFLRDRALMPCAAQSTR